MAFEVRGGGMKGAASHVSHEQAAKLFNDAIAYVTKSDKAMNVYETLNRLPDKIAVFTFIGAEDHYMPKLGGGPYIEWDPLSSLKVTSSGWQSPAVAVIHEMFHAYQDLILKDIFLVNGGFPEKTVRGFAGNQELVPKCEIPTVAFEAQVCEQLARFGHTNETKRTSYIRCLDTVQVKSVTGTGR